jgi:predicted transcriptional regulator
MSKEAIFTMKLESALRDDFIATAAEEDRPAAQIIREMMRDYIEKRREEREYTEFLREKVEAAREDLKAGRWKTNEEVKAIFAAKRKALVAKQV